MPDDIQGLRLLLDRIAQMERDVRHADRLLKVAGEIVVTSIHKNFAAGGRPKHWSPLSVASPGAWLKRKRDKKGRRSNRGNVQILVDTHSLEASVSKRVVAGGVEVGVPDDTGPRGGKRVKRLHFGYPGGSGRGHAHTPARPYIMIQPEDITDIGNVFRRHIARR